MPTRQPTHDAIGTLDAELLRILMDIQSEYLTFPKYIRIRIERWCEKCSERTHILAWKRTNVAYAHMLLRSVRQRFFREPFDFMPISGDLPPIPLYRLNHLRGDAPAVTTTASGVWEKMFKSFPSTFNVDIKSKVENRSKSVDTPHYEALQCYLETTSQRNPLSSPAQRKPVAAETKRRTNENQRLSAAPQLVRDSLADNGSDSGYIQLLTTSVQELKDQVEKSQDENEMLRKTVRETQSSLAATKDALQETNTRLQVANQTSSFNNTHVLKDSSYYQDELNVVKVKHRQQITALLRKYDGSQDPQGKELFQRYSPDNWQGVRNFLDYIDKFQTSTQELCKKCQH